jgi:hypothetical protein
MIRQGGEIGTTWQSRLNPKVDDVRDCRVDFHPDEIGISLRSQ